MCHSKVPKEPEVTWWGDVSGPSVFVRETVGALAEGWHVCLRVPQVLPWPEVFYAKIINALREVDTRLLYEEVEGDVKSPAQYIIELFGLETAYRPTQGPVEFIKSRRVLADKIIRIRAKGLDATKRWLMLANDYKPDLIRDGLILLESDISDFNSVLSNGFPQRVRFLDYDEFISEYDALVFAGLLLPRDLKEVERKKYLAMLAVSLLGSDPVKITNFVKKFQFDRDDPEQWVWGDPLPDNLGRRIWSAQVQTLFPQIMQENRDFIDRWRDRVEDAFDYVNREFPVRLMKGNQEPLESPEEMEPGHLMFLMTQRRKPDAGKGMEYLLYIPDPTARNRMELLRDMRNRLAHGDVCPVAEVNRLLKKDN